MKIDPIDLYGTRLLVFLETEPQSNKYNQVLLNPAQFKAVSNNIGVYLDEECRPGFEVKEVELSDEEYTLPDLQEITEKDLTDKE